jgi:predicted MFS family arabinose efflux permease
MDMRLIWLALGTFAVGTGPFLIASLLPGIAADTGVSIPQAGGLVLVYAIAYAVGAPVLSTLTGGIGRRPVLVGAMAVFGLANVVAGFLPSFAWLLAARVVMAMASGLFASAAQGTAVQLSTPQTRARAISVIVGGSSVSVALGAPIGSMIANAMDWRAAFVSVGILSLVVTAALRALLPGDLSGMRLSMRQRLTVVFRPGVGKALMVSILALAAAFTVYSYLAVVAADAGLAITVLPAVLLTFGIGAIIGNYGSGQLSDRWRPAPLVGWTLAVMAMILLAISGIGHELTSPAAGWALIAMMLPWGFVGWGFPPAQSSLIVGLDHEVAPISLSLNVSAIYVGVALGSVVGGFVLTTGSAKDLGWVAAVLCLLALAVHLTPLRVRRLRPA